MSVLTYKCPNCGGGLVFEPKSQKFKCEYCISDFTEKQLEQFVKKSTERIMEPAADAPEPLQHEAEPLSAPAMILYSCPSCGAEVIADETTAATSCYYCHNPVVLSGRLEGRYEPDNVIPFEMDRKKAEEIFKSWIRNKRYIPGDFYSPRQIELMEGVYYPYWMYSCVVDGTIKAEAVRKRSTVSGSVRYIEMNNYAIERQGSMPIEHVGRNALKKAERQLSEKVLPFDMAKMRPFDAGYLSGFKAERRDRDKEEFQAEVENEVKQFAESSLVGSLSGYDSVKVKEKEQKLRDTKWIYTLLPVWVMTYKEHKTDQIYYFAMNGQNGKVCGILPVDYKKLAGLFSMIFFPVFLLLLLGGYLI